MIKEERVSELKKSLQSLAAYKDLNLISRPEEWAAINFKQVEANIESILFLTTELLNLPLEHLTNDALSQILNHIPEVVEQLRSIDSFSLEAGGSIGSRDQICSVLQEVSERFCASVGPHLPYLAYRRGDFAGNITNLNKAVNEAREILESTKEEVTAKKNEIANIFNATREAAASAGVATFTAEFNSEAKRLQTQSKKWLIGTAVLAVATILAAVGFYYWPEVSDEASGWETLRNVISKTAIIAVLFTATIWCGRIYRALIHQAAVNNHRALSLKTFQAFVKATDDSYVRDAVLMAATKAVFASVPTGFVNHPGGDRDTGVNFVEFGKPSIEKVAETVTTE